MMDDILKDTRFTKLVNDPRYRQIPKTERKVKIDKRFESMFNNDKFKVKYTVDKRGRPVNQSSAENLKKYYDLTSDEDSDGEDSDDEDKPDESPEAVEDGEGNESFGAYVLRPKSDSEEEPDKSDGEIDEEAEKSDTGVKEVVLTDELIGGKLPKEIKNKLRDLEVDYARGEGVLFSDSSSDEESAEEEEHVEHGWGELDADAETTDDTTSRLALCNMDWDNIKASDLYVLFTSFLPPGGLIKSITIYPSEYGIQRMKEEELRGPMELTETKNKKTKKEESSSEEDEGNEEGSKYHMEKLRKYQLNRLKYYYAVVDCDSPTTANKIYTDCDGIEYESSATKLDLRFIPDDVTFDQEVHDECLEITDVGRYKPRLFTTTALQQARVELTWDAANPHRTEVLRGAADGDVRDEDLKNYLNCSSEEESEVEEPEDKDKEDTESLATTSTADPISKYKALLLDIENNESKKKNRGLEMEITWGLGLKEKTEKMVNKKLTKGDKLTPFEELVEKRRDKKKAKKLERKKQIKKEKEGGGDGDENGLSSDDIPSDVDMNDSYFAEEFDNPEFKSNKKSKKKNSKHHKESDSEDEEELRKKAELELLLDDDDGKEHFSLKKIQDAENETKSKKKRKHKEKMKHKVHDKGAVPDGFEIDVADSRFSALYTSHHYNIDPTDSNFKKTKAMDTLIQEKLKRRPAEISEESTQSKKPKKDAAMSVLVKSIKRKALNASNQ